MQQYAIMGESASITSYPALVTGAPVVAPASSLEARYLTPRKSLGDWASGIVVSDALSTTITAQASAGAESITLAAGTFVAGRQYLLRDAQGTVVVRAANSSASGGAMIVSEPLPRTVASGAAVLGWAVVVSIDDEDTVDAGPCILQIRGEVGGSPVQWSDSFRIVRRLPLLTLTPEKLTTDYPIIHTLRAGTDGNLYELIEAAFATRIEPRMALKGVLAEDIVNPRPVEHVHAIACVVHMLEMRPNQDIEFVRMWRQRLESELGSMLGRADWHDHPQSSEPGAPALIPGPTAYIRASR